eukprot:PhM_4_TR15491/c0_g1_i3/m.5022
MPKFILKILRCNHLLQADSFGKSDPFVEALLWGQRVRTPTIKNTLDPVFPNAPTSFHTPVLNNNNNNNKNNCDELHLRVLDEDMLSDDFIGEVRIDVHTLPKGVSVVKTYDLTGVRTGTITVEMCAVDFGELRPVGASGGGLSKRGISAELSSEFSFDLIEAIYDVLVRADVDANATFSPTELGTIIQELHYMTGTPVPLDTQLFSEVRDLITTFDKDRNGVLDIKEMCELLKKTSWKASLRSKWRRPSQHRQRLAGAPAPPHDHTVGSRVQVPRADGHMYTGTVQGSRNGIYDVLLDGGQLVAMDAAFVYDIADVALGAGAVVARGAYDTAGTVGGYTVSGAHTAYGAVQEHAPGIARGAYDTAGTVGGYARDAVDDIDTSDISNMMKKAGIMVGDLDGLMKGLNDMF